MLVCREQERARGFSLYLLQAPFSNIYKGQTLNLINVSWFCTGRRETWYSVVPYVVNTYSSFVVEVSGLCSSSISFLPQ